MSDGDLNGERGELRATIEIKRAATGKVETYELVGFSDPADLDAFLADPANGLRVSGEAHLAREVDEADLIDQSAVVDQAAVTSTVTVTGATTERRYSDGTIQRNIWGSEEEAQAFAASVNEQGA